MSPLPPRPTYILAGGRSRRFGSDKARARLAGRTLVERLAEQLEPSAAGLVIIADTPDKYADLGLTTIADLCPGQGPVGGLATALDHQSSRGETGWFRLLACDLADSPLGWFAVLEPHATAHGSAAFCRNERWQPLPGLYHPRIRSTVTRYLREGGRAMTPLLEQLEAAPVPPPWNQPRLRQINTREDLRWVREERG